MSSASTVPGTEIVLIDNTIYQEENDTTVATPDFNGIQVGFSAFGRDNVLLYYTSKEQFLAENGNPNYKLYGQSAYNACAALATNQCGMYFMRLMPEDATVPNFTVMARVRAAVADETSVDDVVGDMEDTGMRLYVDFTKRVIEGCTSERELKTKLAALYDTSGAVDEEGWTELPLFSFWSRGRGAGGNSLRIKFVDALDYDLYYEGQTREYTIQVLRPTTSGLAVIDSQTGMIDESAMDITDDHNPSQFIEDRINDVEYGSNYINMMFHSDSWDTIVRMYNSVADNNYQTTVDMLDIIFGRMVSGEPNPYLVLPNAYTLNVQAVDGIALEGGSDGAFATADAERAKEEMLIKAFAGDVDSAIKSKFASPADFNLDANYSDSVKRQMAALAILRKYDAMTYLDSGLLEQTGEYSNWLVSMRDVYAYNLVKECGMYEWRDNEFTGKLIPLTMTHWLARKLPVHMSINSLTTPMAKDNCMLVGGTDFVTGTFRPVIDPDNETVKNIFWKFKSNVYESVGRNRFQRAWAITTCQELSDRADEFNEYILHRAVAIAYAIMNSKIYKIGEESDRIAYQKHAEKEIKYQLGNFLRSVTVEFVMTAKDEKQNRMRLKLRLVYKTVIHRGIVEIYLDPRVASSASTAATIA